MQLLRVRAAGGRLVCSRHGDRNLAILERWSILIDTFGKAWSKGISGIDVRLLFWSGIRRDPIQPPLEDRRSPKYWGMCRTSTEITFTSGEIFAAGPCSPRVQVRVSPPPHRRVGGGQGCHLL